ncbi:MAG: hypothetical protein LKK12_00915 [Bacteroidales bacterium]|jgi:hypothetical protein|nr:hypothetical protein [Bacteroidales bacterium]MCI2132923.1 hypothetical protein [Bacteroidales bacterium]
MIHKNVQMMDAGCVLFQTEKPYGIVLGGVKREMEKYGKVLRKTEFNPEDLPETTGDCDLFLDWSAWHRLRCIACKVEEAGIVGKTDEGEEIHRYAATFKEGNANAPIRKIFAWGLAILLLLVSIFIKFPIPRSLAIIIAIVLGIGTAILLLRPSQKAQSAIRSLCSIIAQAK